MVNGGGAGVIAERCGSVNELNGAHVLSEAKFSARVSATVRDMFGRYSASARGDVWRLKVLKATARTNEAPNLKLLKNIVSGVDYYGCDVGSAQSVPRIVVEVLRQRLAKQDWIIVFKALTCLHHVLRETANQSFVDLVAAEYSDLLDMGKFNDTNPKAAPFRSLVVSYADYLRAYCAARKTTQYPPVKNNIVDPYANYEKFFHQQFETAEGCKKRAAVAPLHKILRAFFNIPFSITENSGVAAHAVEMLSKDLCHIWNSFQVCISYCYRTPTDCPQPYSLKIFDDFDAFCKEAKLVIECIEGCIGPFRRPRIRCKGDLMSQ
eukprot:Plantae.Rhodophyta-Purpureofilum_apyrenoidigerum.ctg11754.p1 GENE.Plantae.Rhodophyta-Purpureofilum_apyrenoidigerum.ctg11754~~Plantae.Rhodophyta-Purpureofilum_apyrenoidigerum.ctg11754.p1  ORF type:complete len:322 (-),score=61.02 Plantae.Rhodophyta-Purpureofilum_apyrenoidigerum.ctg11754:146-1111(-)